LISYIIAPVIIVAEISAQKIGEEKYSKENKNDEKFNENDHPYSSAPGGQIHETVIIESVHSFYCQNDTGHTF